MGTYRVEISENNRAGCKNTACKTQNVKIQKGELRLGTLVEIKDHRSWSWKHWGCVTPAQIQNIKTSIDDDLDNLDGYDIVSTEMQVKIKDAMDQGHVADDDWSGDVELNRPGKKGMHKRASKKEDGETHEDENDVGKSDAKPATKKRSRGKKDAEDEEKPAVTKKSKTGPKKVKPTATAADDVANIEDDEQSPKKAKATGKKAKVAAAAASSIHDNSNEAAVSRKTRSGGKYKPAPAGVDESEPDVDEESAPKAKVSKKKADKGGGDKSAPREPAKPNGKTSPVPKGRKAVPKSAERVEDSEDEDVEGYTVPKKVTKESKAETRTSGKGNAKDGGAVKTSTLKGKKVKKTSAKK